MMPLILEGGHQQLYAVGSHHTTEPTILTGNLPEMVKYLSPQRRLSLGHPPPYAVDPHQSAKTNHTHRQFASDDQASPFSPQAVTSTNLPLERLTPHTFALLRKLLSRRIPSW